MTPETISTKPQTATPASTQPEQVLSWLATQATPDHGESTPPMPADLLSDIQKTFGIAPEAPRVLERASLWSRVSEVFSSRSVMAWGGALTAACVVALFVWQNGHQTGTGGVSGSDTDMRGGKPVATVPGISWHWIGLENFPTEQAKLEKEGFISDSTSTSIVVTLDAAADPLQVLVSTVKDGVPQPILFTQLPKQSLPAMRPAVWVNSLQQLQSKLQSPP
jgi:hypothetical protein